MGLFGRGKSGGVMNVIRCDEQEYLIWKWRPEGQEVNSTSRENAIRYGSSLRVKDGEVAVFVYKQKDGTMQDFIVGPFDQMIKTANFPVLSSIVGLAYGESPFQADIHFINVSRVVQVRFGVPYFDVADPRFIDFVVPFSAGGTLTFSIDDYKRFVNVHRLVNFTMEDFENQIRDTVIRRVKGIVTNAPIDYNMSLFQIERRIDEINDRIEERLKRDLSEDFAIELRRLDLSRLEADKDSQGWRTLKAATADIQSRTIEAQADVNIKNLYAQQEINTANLEESLRIQREESQRAQRLTTESQFMGAHALNRQADVLETAAGNMGAGGSGGSDGGMNPAGMMTGMMLGGAMGGQMANMANTMGAAMNGQFAGTVGTPPPLPQVSYMIAVGQQSSGPFDMNQLSQLVASGQMTSKTLVWKQGMPQWAEAGSVAELQPLFASQFSGAVPPPIP